MLSKTEQRSARALLLNQPGLSIQHVAAKLNLDAAALYPWAKKHGLSTLRLRLRNSPRRAVTRNDRKYASTHQIITLRPGLMIHFDATPLAILRTRANAPEHVITAFCATDRCTGWRLYALRDTESTPGAAADALHECAKRSPFTWFDAYVVTDNGHDMTAAPLFNQMAALRCHHRRILPGQPWSNGHAERCLGTLRYALAAIPAEELRTLDQLTAATQAIEHDANHRPAKPHLSSPAEQLAAYNASPEGWLHRLVAMKLLTDEKLASAIPLRLLPGSTLMWEPIADRIADLNFDQVPDALGVRRNPSASPGYLRPPTRLRRNAKPGIYFFAH